MAMIEALGRAKLSRHWIQFRVTAYAVPLFSAIIDASLLYNVVAERPIPPVVDNTSGMNVARSTPRIRTRWSYSRLALAHACNTRMIGDHYNSIGRSG